jgi:hypothetical protein
MKTFPCYLLAADEFCFFGVDHNSIKNTSYICQLQVELLVQLLFDNPKTREVGKGTVRRQSIFHLYLSGAEYQELMADSLK